MPIKSYEIYFQGFRRSMSEAELSTIFRISIKVTVIAELIKLFPFLKELGNTMT